MHETLSRSGERLEKRSDRRVAEAAPRSSAPAKRPPQSRPEQLLHLAARLAGASQGALGLLSPDGEVLEVYPFGLGEDAIPTLLRSRWLAELFRLLLRHSRPLRLADGPPALEAACPCQPLGPFVGVPLVSPAGWRGGLYLARSPGALPFGSADEEALQLLRPWGERDDLFEDSRLLAQLRLLTHVAQAAAGSHDLTRLLQIAFRELDRQLPLHVCAVWLIEDAPTPALVLVSAGTTPDDRAAQLGLVPGQRLPLDMPPLAACVRDGQAVYTDLKQPEECGGPLARELAARGANASFAVPLRTGDRTVGVLQTVCTRPTGITAEQIQLLYLVADLLGPAVSNCQLFGRLRGAYEDLGRTQNQLVQAEKMRALGEMAGGMAHEFNNALCGTLGFLELSLLSPDLSCACRTYLESARTCAQDAAETVRRVQEFTRQQRSELPFQVLDLNALVRQTVDLARPRWEVDASRGRAITVDVQTRATVHIAGNQTELREVLTNLIFNAVDAMPQGGTLSVRTRGTLSDGYLEVQDTGVGINEAVRRRLFEPFFTTKGERGNGLGLSVSFAIVRRHGGEIAVDSQVGRGTTFTVRLPAAVEAPPSVSPADAAPAKPATSLRILVIEDEEAVRRFLGASLTSLGHRPRLAADGHEGLAALGEEAFDVLLTDLGLPGVSGEEVARQAASRSPQTPVILLTGWADQLKESVGSIDGVAHLLSKPVSLARLTATLAAVTAK